jgi:hypothetical protein
MEKKIQKIQNGENSIEVVTNRMNEILKLETNVRDHILIIQL